MPNTPKHRLVNRLIHLETKLSARLLQPDYLDVLNAIHPTPAVCGLPTATAAHYLSRHEHLHRGLYAGAIGWMTPEARAEPELSRDEATATDGTHQPIEDLREKIKSIGHHLTDSETGRTREKADAMPRAAGMMLMPFGLMVRQQARVWNLMLDALEMQRQFVEIWRPPHR